MSHDLDALARRAAGGDAVALDSLVALVRPEVLRLCARFLAHADDAEDACQDALLALTRSIGGFEGRSAFRTWLYRLTANQARSTYQRLRGRFLAESSGAPLSDPPDPRRTSVVAGTRLDLLDALAAIGPEFAEAVVLRDVTGLTYREIAGLLAVPEGTVKSRIHHGRALLRSRLTADRGA
jgi:RNA polymerase sigma-70 factor (ECF subfamily)